MPNSLFDIDLAVSLLATYFVTVKTPIVELIHAQTKDPFKVLVATLLSARTKDETTSRVVTKLFKVVNTPHDFDLLSESEVDKIIYQVGFHNTKAKHLKMLPSVLDELFNGIIPSEIDDLIKLPGVGRKTANLVRAIAFSLPAICVDVHVHRITNRWGYVTTETPFETEMALRNILPAKYWLVINSFVVAFGQSLCFPRKPNCTVCPLHEICPRIGV